MTLQKSRALNVLAAAAALACMAGAHAEETSYNPNDYILLNGSAIQPDSKLVPNKIGAGGGLKLGIPLNPSWDLQIGGNYAESNDNGGKYHQYLAGVDALYLLRPAGFRPFLLGGVGVSRDSSSDPVNGSFRRTSPYVNAGLGFQYKINPQLGVQADIREVASFYRDKVNAPDMSRSANTYVNVGLTWAFGGPPAPPPPIVKRVDTTTTTTVETTPPPPPPKMQKYTLSASELFGFNSAKLGPNQPKLDEVAATMSANSDIQSVTIVGYTDKIGSSTYNQKLSVQRAESVKAYLVSKGVPSSRLQAVGKGEADPVVECADVKKHAELIKCLEPNRRVEIEPVTFTKQVQ